MNAGELTLTVTAIANFLAENMTTEEINLLSAALMQLGDTLSVIAAQRSFCEK